VKFMMTMKEAMSARHMVRKYTDKAIPTEIVTLLNERIVEKNRTHGLNLTLVTGNSDGLGGMAKLLLARGVNNYFVLAGADSPGLDEKLGYCGADFIIYAQALGASSVRVNGIIVGGYGATVGVSHKSKEPTEISEYNGTTPEWFKNGVEALLLAPTALNKQAFKVRGDGNQVSLTCDSGHFAGIDLGIGKYHFEVGAGKENFEWS